jgi:hypothetical protein
MNTAQTPDQAPLGKTPLTLDLIASLYPALYSEKRLREWQQLFDSRAVAVRIERGAPTKFLNVHDAMPEQKEYAAENDTLLESWENVEVRQFGNVAVIKADYTLIADTETRKGVDVLTLVNDDAGWRIVSIAYEQTHLIAR